MVLEHGAGDHIDSRDRQVTNSRDFLALNLGNSFSCSGNFASRSEENYTLHGSRRAIDQVKNQPSTPHAFSWLSDLVRMVDL